MMAATKTRIGVTGSFTLLVGGAYSIVYPRSAPARYADAGSIASSQSRSRAAAANVN